MAWEETALIQCEKLLMSVGWWRFLVKTVTLKDYSDTSGSPNVWMRGTGAGDLLDGQIPQARTSPASPVTADRSPAQSRELLFFLDVVDVVDEPVELWTSKGLEKRGEDVVGVLQNTGASAQVSPTVTGWLQVTRRSLSVFVHKVL